MLFGELKVSASTGVGNNTTEDWSLPPRGTLLDAVNSSIACLAVLGNGMVITVMLVRRRVFSSFTNRLILHQSVIDAITGVVLFLLHVVKGPTIAISVESNSYDNFVCRFIDSDFLLWCMNVTSTYNLVTISMERFMAICYPVRHRNTWTTRKLRFVVATVWMIGLVFTVRIPLIFEANQGYCDFVEIRPSLIAFINAMAFGTEYLVPITIIIYAYIRIMIMLHTRKVANPANCQQNIMSKAKKDVLTTTLLISITFVVCWTPMELGYFHDFVSNNNWDEPLYSALSALVACNMFVNPIIYSVKYKHFRSQLKTLFVNGCQRNRVHNGEPNPLNPR